MVITMAKLRMAHASTHGARKPPGPTLFLEDPVEPSRMRDVESGTSDRKTGGILKLFTLRA